jgi:hypothetical protein
VLSHSVLREAGQIGPSEIAHQAAGSVIVVPAMAESFEVVDRERLEVVLDPSFVESLDALSLADVRERRDRALAEREYLSYLRRLLQTRYDLLSAERDRRAAGEATQPLVERLTSILSEGGRQVPSRGEAVRTTLSEEDVNRAEERAAAVLGPFGLHNPDSLDDAQVAAALDALEAEERGVSADRLAVLRVHDRLQEELKRRFREDPASITREA